MIEYLKDLSIKSEPFYGSKAANLGELINAGFEVPAGIALSFDVYDEYLKHNKFTFTPSQYLVNSKEIIPEIKKGEMPNDIRECIWSHLNLLNDGDEKFSFVVRSSSITEDTSSNSMAGMFESYINLSTYIEIEEAIKKCYASLFSDKVLHYIYETDRDMAELKMGVIVQKFIEGQPSGVIFTADTINMDTGFLHINAVDSICADFVDGKLPSSLYIMEKGSKKVKEECINANSPALSADMLNRLYDISMKIEPIFGGCQDIEWTSAAGDIYILQTRPITTLRTNDFPVNWASAGDENYTWNRLIPEPLTPLMQDIISIEVDSLSNGAYDTVCRLDTYRTYTIQNSYAYIRNKEIENITEKRLSFNNLLIEYENQGKCVYHDKILPVIMPLIDTLNGFVGKNLSREEAGEFFKLSLEYLKKTWSLHWLAAMVNMFLMKFENYFLKTFSDMQTHDFYDLVYNFSILARERELFFTMSAVVKNNSTLKTMFDSCAYDEIIYERLKTEPEARELMELIEIYIKEFGLCDTGVEHMLNPVHKLYPVIMERPDYIIGQIRNLMDADENVFFESVEVSLLNKTTVRNSIMERLDADGREEFLKKLALAEKAFIANDNHNYYIERMYRGYLRLAVMEAGRILNAESLLDKPGDIQYLYSNEIISVLNGDKNCRKKIQNRKREYEKHKKLLPPHVIGKAIDEKHLNNSHSKAVKSQSVNGTTVINGVSGLRKKISGKVYVGMPKRLNDERILVLPHTHYGDIMPLLSKVKGLIFSGGSPYDHPGIIARELGIPAIYKANNAMELLKTDDEVELDGYTGEIAILNKA